MFLQLLRSQGSLNPATGKLTLRSGLPYWQICGKRPADMIGRARDFLHKHVSPKVHTYEGGRALSCKTQLG